MWEDSKLSLFSRATGAEAFVTAVDPIFLELVGGHQLAAILPTSPNFTFARSQSYNSSAKIVLTYFIR